LNSRGRSLSAALASLDTSPESPERPLQFSPIDMDLLGDMQDVIFRDCFQLGERARRDLEEDDSKLLVDRSVSFPSWRNIFNLAAALLCFIVFI
jgi:hypothetical protein